MKSVIGKEYIQMENSQNENQHQITKIKQISLMYVPIMIQSVYIHA